MNTRALRHALRVAAITYLGGTLPKAVPAPGAGPTAQGMPFDPRRNWGMLSRVASDLGVSRTAVSMVARGKKTSRRISNALAIAIRHADEPDQLAVSCVEHAEYRKKHPLEELSDQEQLDFALYMEGVASHDLLKDFWRRKASALARQIPGAASAVMPSADADGNAHRGSEVGAGNAFVSPQAAKEKRS